jgi:Putative phage tail protein
MISLPAYHGQPIQQAAMIVIFAVTTAIEVGMMIYQLLNQPKIRPPVQDQQIMSSADGAPIAFGYAVFRIGGQLIWSSGVTFVTKSVGGGFLGSGGGGKQFIYYSDFAVAFCEGIGSIRRMWGDSKLIYDPSPNASDFPPGDFPPWSGAVTYNIGDIVNFGGQVWSALAISTNFTPGSDTAFTDPQHWTVLGGSPLWVAGSQYNPGDTVTVSGAIFVSISPSGGSVGDKFPPDHPGYWQPLAKYYPPPAIYPGDHQQLQDPTIESFEGVDNTSAMRGLIYASFQKFPLQNFGNRIPSVRAEIVMGGTGSSVIVQVPIGDIITDVCIRAGIPADEIDVSLLTQDNVHPTNLCDGYAITRPTKAAEAIKVLFDSFFINGCESDGKLKFIPRGLDPVLTIAEDQIGLESDKAKMKPEQLTDPDTLPQSITITYNDQAIDFQQGKQQKSRSTRVTQSKQQEIREVNMTMTSTFARGAAEKALFLAWLERTGYAMNLWNPYFMALDPTDVVNVLFDGIEVTVRIVDDTLGAGFLTAVNAVSENPKNYLSKIAGAASNSGFKPPPVLVIPPTTLALFDTPLLRDADSNPGGTGYYAMMTSTFPTWKGASLNRSTDDAGFGEIDEDPGPPVLFGYTTTVLGDPSAPFALDATNTVTVKMSLGTLASDTLANLNAGANALLIGTPEGTVEVVQFETAVHNSDGTYTLSNLRRGLRGTEYACGFWGDFYNGTNSHAIGDIVVVIPGGMRHETDALSTINELFYYRAISSGADISTGAPSTQFTNRGNDLRPYAPILIGGDAVAGDFTISWTRRTRLGASDPWGRLPGPISETTELYEVEILNGSTVVRTITEITTPSVVYTNAEATADFGTPPTDFYVNVYQISSSIGRGFKGHGHVNGSPPSPPVLPVCADDITINGV